MTLNIRPYRPAEQGSLIALWTACGLVVPWNDPRKDIERKLAVDPELLLVGEVGGLLAASVMVGYEGHRGWINYLAVAPEFRGRGYGRQLMLEAERLLRARGCPKINLQVRSSNLDIQKFYHELGYTQDQAISMGKRLEEDS